MSNINTPIYDFSGTTVGTKKGFTLQVLERKAALSTPICAQSVHCSLWKKFQSSTQVPLVDHARVHICIPGMGQTFLGPFIWRGEKSWIHLSSLWLSTQYFSIPSPSTFPLTAYRSIKLQEPFVPGSLSAEAVLPIYTDLPDPLLVPSHGERGTVGDSMLSLL